jgi:molecular chaperone DnaK
MESNSHVIGIDLGTTNSVVAVVENGEPVIIPNAEGRPSTPSVIAFDKKGGPVVGELARRQAATQPEKTISSVKRLIGRLFEEIQEQEEQYPFELGEDENGRVLVTVGDREYLPEELSALILGKLKESAEDYLGEPASRAVVTVPAYFDDRQRQATMEAARMAGLEVLRLINEPTAAAMAYGLAQENSGIVAVYDFGGGTFDFSILSIEDKTFEVLVSTGDSRLGGDDLDAVLTDHLAEVFEEENGIDLREDILTLRRLKDAAETAKCELSAAEETLVSLPFIAYREGEPLHLDTRVTRSEFEEMIEPLVEASMSCCRKGLRKADLKADAISRVILVGGSTRIPLIQDSVEEFFDITPYKGLNPDEIVAAGAATQGAVMNGELEEVVLLDVTPHNLGIEIRGNRFSNIVEKNSTIPIKIFKTFTTTEDDQPFVNIHVLQGEGEKASDCRSLGKISLTGIEEARAGVPRIRVTFFINADGIVEISAADMANGNEKSLTINHAYLNSDERRKSSSVRRRERKRKRIKSKADSPGRRGKSVQPARGKARAGAGKESKRNLSDTNQVETLSPDELIDGFTEVDTHPPERKTTKKSSPARPKNSVAGKPPEQPAIPPESAGENGSQESVVTGSVASDESEVVVNAETMIGNQSADVLKVLDTKNDSDPKAGIGDPGQEFESTPAIMPECEIPEELQDLVGQLVQNCCDSAACELYQEMADTFRQFCVDHPSDPGILLLQARHSIHTRNPEDARSILIGFRESMPDQQTVFYRHYSELCRQFPNYTEARHERAGLALEAEDYDTAASDLEFVVQQDADNENARMELKRVYEAGIQATPDPKIQFKLVKLYLRDQELDEAIGLLQKLVSNPKYRDRANKVLGLCFWQKGMRYLAWQKFRTLKMTDEMKDILYRLAEDMEMHDELLHAKYCLEKIYESDIAYREIDSRLKKLSYRLELVKDEKYGGLIGARQPMQVEEGYQIGGRFEVLCEINRGSMGIVYKARDMTLDEVVAIKVLNDYLCADPEAIERFKQEARSARKLTHQNLVRIHDLFDLEGKKIISMEYIEGDDLKTVFKRNVTLSEDLVLNYLVQICAGLAYAHRLNIVHRDIKPANIMITDKGQIKITDFGIAKILTDHHTKAGTMVMGTPLYMAPEQIQGEKIDHRCDIYALGVMLYELICGKPPFVEGNIEYQHIHSQVPELENGVNDKIKRVIMRCLEKDPSKRFQNADEILARII